jgi:WD40 repeat protein
MFETHVSNMNALDRLKQNAIVEITGIPKLDASIGSLAFSPDGQTLFIGCDKGRLYWLDVPTRTITKQKEYSFENNYGDAVVHTFCSLAVTSSNPMVFAASRVGLVVLDPDGNKLFSDNLQGWYSPLVKVTPDEKFFAVSDDQRLLIYERDSFRNSCQFNTGGDCIGLSFSHDSNFLLAAGKEGKFIQKWNFHTGGKEWEFPAHDGIILDLAIDASDTYVVSSGEDFSIKKWDLKSKSELPITGWANGKENQMKFSPDGSVLATASLSRVLALRDPATLESVWQSPFENYCLAVDFSRDGRLLAAADDRGMLRIWQLA